MNFTPLIFLTVLLSFTSGDDSSESSQSRVTTQSDSVVSTIADDDSSTLSLTFPTETTTAVNDTVFLDFYPVALNYSIVYNNPIMWTTYTPYALKSNGTTISSNILYFETAGTVLATTTLNQYSTITKTRAVTSGEVGHNSLETTVTPTITSNVQDVISCGMKALIYDYYQNSTSFDEFITQNSNESYVQSPLQFHLPIAG
ncbi:unnamed protein product [Ambrosiozyma monospora]|uniref:Unnamed protein product n=1 Tax=Ambrosiozyma monospora TaxID=43982 RepID=A0ACB5UEB7_AMBMO|nr:unnamed protein product [Ambrosiozyma monospora]